MRLSPPVSNARATPSHMFLLIPRPRLAERASLRAPPELHQLISRIRVRECQIRDASRCMRSCHSTLEILDPRGHAGDGRLRHRTKVLASAKPEPCPHPAHHSTQWNIGMMTARLLLIVRIRRTAGPSRRGRLRLAVGELVLVDLMRTEHRQQQRRQQHTRPMTMLLSARPRVHANRALPPPGPGPPAHVLHKPPCVPVAPAKCKRRQGGDGF